MSLCFVHLTIIFLLGEVLNTAVGLKWVSLKSGDPIPPNVIYVDEYIVGRAKGDSNYFVPAEVSAAGDAQIKDEIESTYVTKTHFEVLTTSEHDKCEWKPYYYRKHYKDIDQNIVRIGLQPTHNDTIFIGRTYVGHKSKHISSILLPKQKQTERWEYVPSSKHGAEQWEYLSCDTSIIWLKSTSFDNLPSTAVSAGQTNDGDEMFVARAKQEDGYVLPGYVIPAQNAAVFDDSEKDSTVSDEDAYSFASDGGYEILVGEPNEYEWVVVEDGLIPDYAVVNERLDLEPVFLAKIEGNVRSITQSKALKEKPGFKILVQNSN